MKVREVLAEIRKAGPVFVTMLVRNDTVYIEARKEALKDWLGRYDPEAEAPVTAVRTEDGLYLDND